ncbi:aspartate--tRNA ligase [bacterium]|nr:aspartate--tRNA ligase [candidate division CSSED10-310 bacterium]
MTQTKLFERTHYCADVLTSRLGDEVIVAGWVRKRRDLGKLIFVDLYDRTGVLQVVFDPERNPELMNSAGDLKRESVLVVKGNVSERPPDARNPEMLTGNLELIATQMRVFNTSKVPPFHLIGDQEVTEELRLKFRYLDLRRPEMFRIMKIRHDTQQIVHQFYSDHGFMEIVTPHLIRSTPEGARDFLVPSRLHKGSSYALPQSPQMLKQMLMIAGVDRYFQIVKCFRDEDSRADRQPEFSQIDVEMSFTATDTLFNIHEALMQKIFHKVLNVSVECPFPRISYQEAMEHYGSDKPDVRFELKIKDITDLCMGSGFGVIDNIIEKGGIVRGVRYPGGASLSRKQIQDLESIVKVRGAGGLVALRIANDGNISGSPLVDLLTPSQRDTLKSTLNATANDLICIVAGMKSIVENSLGTLRLHIAKQLKLMTDDLAFTWVTDFPLLEYDEIEKRYQAMHHPFTAPHPEDLDLLESNPQACRAQAYDLVLNGVELGGGSVRIHDRILQNRVFQAIGMSQEDAQKRFGFFLEALEYGTPPHCGIAFGMDRLIMMLAGTDNLRDVIPFPKTLQAVCLLTAAPSPVTNEQLEVLGIKLINDQQKHCET